MASQKQRRRRQKLRRHEWEEVLVDEEGNEVVVEPEERPAKEKEKNARRATKAPARRPIREVPPPSWNRVLRRAAIFAPLMFLTVHFLSGDKLSLPSKVLQTLFLLAFFLPFSYVMDRVAYRAYQRRLERG